MKKVLIACAYFDWFSNYQEISLAKALQPIADVHVLAGNKANPIFSEAHLNELGITRTYPEGTGRENGIRITRVPVRDLRSMSLSLKYREESRRLDYDLVIQVMPGHLLSALASRPRGNPPRIVLYGDNAAMYSHLSPALRSLKRMVFSATKGIVYRYCNKGATAAYCYTPDTIKRLRPFLAGAPATLLPLSFDNKVFYFDNNARDSFRSSIGVKPAEKIIVTAGKAKSKKRIDLLVKAFSIIASADRTVRLVIAGAAHGVGAELTQRAIADSPYSSRITTLPIMPTSELNSLFSAADIGCWPFMPAVTIQQAMGTGLPVVIPHNDIVGHLITDPSSGIYFDGDEPNADRLAEALLSSLNFGFDLETRSRRESHNQWLSSQQITNAILDLGGDPAKQE